MRLCCSSCNKSAPSLAEDSRVSELSLGTKKSDQSSDPTRTGGESSLARGLAFGACRLPNDAGLIFKVLGRETAAVKEKVREFWSIVREEVAAAPVPPPFLWR